MAEYVLFDKAHGAKDILRAIKEQGTDVCRDTFEKAVVSASTEASTVGYVRMTPRASIGQKRRRTTEMTVHSFILGRPAAFAPNVWAVELVCSRPTIRDGGVLLNLMETYAAANGYVSVFLTAIGEERLLRWYNRQGYKLANTNLQSSVIKSYNLFKSLGAKGG